MFVRQKTRRHERVPFGHDVRLWTFRTPLSVRAKDISPGGLLLTGPAELLVGSFLTLQITLPGEAMFSTMCKVVRHTELDVGLQFLDLSPRDQRRIEQYTAQPRTPAEAHA